MIKANIILDNFQWKNKFKDPNIYFKNKLKKLSKILNLNKKKQEFSVLLTNNKKMRNLNDKFRKKNIPTDVLSFPLNDKGEKNIYIGDIAISYEIIKQRAKKTNFFIEFDKIWIHGYLHLIGYDHKNLRDFEKMSKKENLILKYFKK